MDGQLACWQGFIALKGILGGILGLTGLPALMRLLGGGAAAAGGGGAGLGVIGKLGIAGVAAWGGLKVAKAAGLPDVDRDQGIEAVRKGQWWRASSLLSAGDFAGAMMDRAKGKSNADIADGLAKAGAATGGNIKALADSSLTGIEKLTGATKDNGKKQADHAKTATKQAETQTDWLKKIESGISKMSHAFNEGWQGHALPSGSGVGEKVAHAAGSTTGVIVNSALGQIMKKAEGDYNVANFKKAGGGLGVKRFDHNNMTVAQVMAAQSRGEMFATGRYQIIPETLKGAVKAMGLSGNEKYDQAMQDKIFTEYLLKHKRKAIWNYIHGKSDNLNAAMLAMSQEWASFAAPAGAKTHRGLISDGNMSFYAGNGVDKASVSAAQSAAMLQQLRAQVMSSGSTNNRSEVHIGQVNIQTAATDAKGIAQEIRPAVNRQMSGLHASTAT